ncbi:MAG: magnesium/cobalt transporter CorA [Desulforhabdus sp.]|jgi:magnesium transporter|nr:magnesium/cobalt transporter CorA [Desulforhabdus sp.]
MSKFFRRRLKKPGLAPGTLVHIGEKKTEKTKITLIKYDEASYHEKEVQTIEECFSLEDARTTKWINVDGIHQIETIRKIGNHYSLHPLTLEDILNTDQRPKMDDYEDYIFVVLKMFFYIEEHHELMAEQVSLIFRPGLVISFQEKEGDVFDLIRERMRSTKGKIVRYGSDYLTYALIDAIVDHYFVVLERVGERIEYLQEQLVAEPSNEILRGIHELKREMIFLRRSAWPLREIINKMEREESALIQETTVIYLRDVYDHVMQVIDTLETFREMVSGMIDLYLTSISNKMNEVMKVLTIIATIFIPLTFIAGVYGMNFRYMPELEWRWAYFVVLIVMALIGMAMLVYFRKKKWV